MKPTRKPTDEEYAAYDGTHCKGLWAKTSDTWRCPVCNRTKREIMVYGLREGSNARRYGPVGFKCSLHKHHDHSGRDRFPATVICGACNNLDSTLKKTVKAEKNFSFSFEELRSILTTVDINSPIKTVNVEVTLAKKLYMEIK